MNKIVIVEDHPLIAEATRNLILEEFAEKQVTICGSAADAVKLLRAKGPFIDHILLDLDVPGATGFSLAMTIWEMGLHSRCCIVTGADCNDLLTQCQSLGFRGYLLKSMPVAEFVAALRRFFSLDVGFIGKREASAGVDPPIRITRRQTQILAYVKDGLGSKQIASNLDLSVGTVDNHIAAAMAALGASNRTHAVNVAIELGLLRVCCASQPA